MKWTRGGEYVENVGGFVWIFARWVCSDDGVDVFLPAGGRGAGEISKWNMIWRDGWRR